MNPPSDIRTRRSSTRSAFGGLLLVLLGLLAVSPPLGAQLPGLLSGISKGDETRNAPESPEETATRLDQWLKEAKTAFDRISAPGAENALPEGIDSSNLADYRRDLEQTVLGIERHQKLLATVPNVRKTLESARSANAAWTGFAEKPPYSILMIDDFVNQQAAITKKAASYRSSLVHFGTALSSIHDEARRAEENSKRVLAGAAEDTSEGGAGKWRIAADRAKSRLLAVHAAFVQSNISVLQDELESTKSKLGLLGRQIAIATKHATFSDDDLGKVKKAAADRQAALRKEIETLRKRQQEASVGRVRFQADLDKIVKAAPEGTDVSQTPEFVLATVRLEAAEERVEALQFVSDTLGSMDRLESYGPEIYEARRTLMSPQPKATRDAGMTVLQTVAEQLKAWEIVVANELTSVNADLGKQESRASLMPAADPRLPPLNDLRSALWEKQAILQRVSQAVTAQRQIVRRWIAGFDDTYEARPFKERLYGASESVRDLAIRFWNFEVFHYESTVVIGGLPITENHGVTLGKFIIALFLFGLAYFIATRIKNHLQGVVVRRGRIAEAQAKTLSNWLMIVVGLILALITLHFLRIPLTVFAFLGGALAIGLGFGTQTLIKNFISGIIVLFERKVRVGDVVDIGGMQGTVIEVNTRSSVLHGTDGRETLVPNSVFLENTITNLTLNDRVLRRFITVGAAYGSSTQQVIEILKECAERHGLVHDSPTPQVLLQDFGDNALVFRLYFWVSLDGKTFGEAVESDLRLMIEKRFEETGVQFPFPQRDVHLKTDSAVRVELTKRTPPQA